MSTAARRWAEIVAKHEASGESIRAFADARGLNPSTLSWWRWELRRNRRAQGAFMELMVADDDPDGGSEVVLELTAYGARANVGPTTDLTLLRRVLGALC
jgi:transposase-like protein